VSTPVDPSSSLSNKGSFGPNAWLVDDMYDRFLADPNDVSQSWREFFADYQRSTVPTVASAPVVSPASSEQLVEVFDDEATQRRELSPT
jgi:2-oxoglutarate dehydrogenase complex dehydrogenase (E1) component-like enzyme